jgi:aminopeptidase N
MAHMWFGDLVTMKWWDDLWLNESFAEWASHHAAAEATRSTPRPGPASPTPTRTGPTAGPAALDAPDRRRQPRPRGVEVNFDGITYAKGASVLKQLVAWVGEDAFLAGLRRTSEARVRQHRVGRPARRSRRPPAASWKAGPRSGCRPPASTRSPPSSRSTTTAPSPRSRSRRPLHRGLADAAPHRLAIGLYDLVDGGWCAVPGRDDVAGASTEVAELVGEKQPDLVLLNDDDLTYAKIRLDERSLATLVDESSTSFDDSLARALCWGAAWDMTRDAEMRATDFVALVLQGVGTETDLTAVGALLGYAKTRLRCAT